MMESTTAQFHQLPEKQSDISFVHMQKNNNSELKEKQREYAQGKYYVTALGCILEYFAHITFYM